MNKVIESLACVSTSRLFLRSSPSASQRSLSVANASALRPEIVLSSSSREACVKKLKSYHPPKLKKTNSDVGQAAVLVPLCLNKGELGLLYTLRSTKLNTNRGQVSFPGGMYDQADKTLEETAFRETWEELRIPKKKIEVWSNGNPIQRTHVIVHPILGYIGEIVPEELQLNAEEVQEAFVISLKNLCDPSTCRYTQFRDSFTLPTYLAGNHRIWGLTATITHIILKALVPTVYKHELVYSKPLIDYETPNSTSSKAYAS